MTYDRNCFTSNQLLIRVFEKVLLTYVVSSWSLTLDPFVPEKSPNSSQGNCNSHLKLKGDRALILTDLDSAMVIFDFGHFQGVNRGQIWTKNSNLDTSFCKNLRFLKCFKGYLCNYEDFPWSNFQPSLTLFTGVIAPNLPKRPNRVMNQKKLYLLGKVDSNKCQDGRYYYRLCENLGWPFGTGPWGQLRPSLGTHFFCFILKEFCDFSGTWDLRYFIFWRMQFSRTFGFLAKSLVFRQ